jgi:D-alanyl-D-alanine carboxypeptidase/D-alanyl-D-alanine-endopeptidase (penicillin-binding protein 4)
VRKPGLYAGDIFKTLAGSQGIRLRDMSLITSLPEGEVLVARKSAPLRDILRDMLKYSNNLIAEMAGLSATVYRTGTPVSLRASAAEMNVWAKANLGMNAPALVDHSGLGEDSRVSSQDMVTALVRIHGSGILKPLLKSITLRDSKGRPVQNHPIKVEAKTGTLNFVSALAGYLTAPDGRVMAFAVFTADMPRRATLTRAQRERPDGGRAWNGRAKRLQQGLIERWGAFHQTKDTAAL